MLLQIPTAKYVGPTAGALAAAAQASPFGVGLEADTRSKITNERRQQCLDE